MNVSKPTLPPSMGDKQPIKAETLLNPQAAWWVGASYESSVGLSFFFQTMLPPGQLL